MRSTLSALLLLSALALPSALVAQTPSRAAHTYTIPDTDLSLQLPAGWKIKQNKTSLDASHAKNRLTVSAIGMAAGDRDAAISFIKRDLRKRFKALRPVGEPTQTQINGLPTTIYSFKLPAGSKTRIIKLIVSSSPGGRATAIIALVGARAPSDSASALRAVIKSLKAADSRPVSTRLKHKTDKK